MKTFDLFKKITKIAFEVSQNPQPEKLSNFREAILHKMGVNGGMNTAKATMLEQLQQEIEEKDIVSVLKENIIFLVHEGEYCITTILEDQYEYQFYFSLEGDPEEYLSTIPTKSLTEFKINDSGLIEVIDDNGEVITLDVMRGLSDPKLVITEGNFHTITKVTGDKTEVLYALHASQYNRSVTENLFSDYVLDHASNSDEYTSSDISGIIEQGYERIGDSEIFLNLK